MTKTKGIILLILSVLIIELIYISYNKFEKSSLPPQCNDKVIMNNIENILKNEFEKISVVFNQSKPINYKIIDSRVGKLRKYNSDIKNGILAHSERTCYVNIEMDKNGKKLTFPLAYKINHLYKLENWKNAVQLDKITVYGLYDNDIEKKTEDSDLIRDWLDKSYKKDKK